MQGTPGMPPPQQQRPPLVPEPTPAQNSSPVFEFLPGVASLVEDLDSEHPFQKPSRLSRGVSWTCPFVG
eukprot:895998-Rhodomonas_salina.5